MFNTPNIVVISLLDLPVFKLRYSLSHSIVSCLSPFIFYFLSTFTNKMPNFLVVIALAFILINSSTSHPRASYIWAVIKPASESAIWSKVLVLVHTISFVSLIGEILTPRPECPIILVSSVVSYVLCPLTPISK